MTTPWPKYRSVIPAASAARFAHLPSDAEFREFLRAVNSDRSGSVPYGAPAHPHPDSIPGLLAAASARMARENGAEA